MPGLRGDNVTYERSYSDLLAYRDRLLVDDADKCWPWGGTIQSKGYGMVGGRLVHRVVYELVHGTIPAGLTIDHLCRNRACANPSHLEAVTMKENYDRGEGWKGLAVQWERGRSAQASEQDETIAAPLEDDVQEIGEEE
jgi:HNH endonuclease